MSFQPYNHLLLKILKKAKFEAKYTLKSKIIKPEHILLAFLKSVKYSTYKILKKNNFLYKPILKVFKKNYQLKPNFNKKNKKYTFSLTIIKLIKNAEKLKLLLKQSLLSPEILLFSTLNTNTNSLMCLILNNNKYNVTKIKSELIASLTKSVKLFLTSLALKNAVSEHEENFLSFYGFLMYKNDFVTRVYYDQKYIKNLTALNDYIYTVGQKNIIKKVTNILSLKEENNLIIYGNAGVGKSTFPYNIINYINENEVSLDLLMKEFIELNLSEILKNIPIPEKNSEESEDKNKNIFRDILKEFFKCTAILRNKVVIIDNLELLFNPKQIHPYQTSKIHTLKPFFTKKNLFNFIGLIDTLNYNEFIKQDKIISKYIKSLELIPLDFNETLMVVNNIKKYYEMYYNIKITDNGLLGILDSSKNLSSPYEMPKRAIVLLDEACSYIKNIKFSENNELKKLIFKLKLPHINYLYNNSVQKNKYRLANLFYKYEQSIYLFLEIFTKFLNEFFNSEKFNAKNDLMLSNILLNLVSANLFKLTSLDISNILTANSKIKGPTQLTLDELILLEATIQENIIGQAEAITSLVKAIRRDALKIRDKNRPIGTFLFAGPTGVGKTEIAKVFTKVVYKSEDALIRFDMSEYSESHSISKLIGATAGYKGFDEGGQLTNAIRKNPFSVILFDEIEKSHSNIYNLLLQVLDEGRLTTSKGETVSFTNTLIIITSNLGAKELLESKKKTLNESENGIKKLNTKSYFEEEEAKNKKIKNIIKTFTDEVDKNKIETYTENQKNKLLEKNIKNTLKSCFLNINDNITNDNKEEILKSEDENANNIKPATTTVDNYLDLLSDDELEKVDDENITEEEKLQIEKENIEEIVNDEVVTKLPPEFINRLDGIITFGFFNEKNAYAITKLLIENFCNKMFELKKYKINYNLKIINKIVKESFDVKLGARPLKRKISEVIETPFAEFLISSKNTESSYFYITLDEDNNIVCTSN